MSRALLACALLLCACNSAPKNECTPTAHSLVSAGNPAASCDGICASIPIAGDGGDASFVFCTIDCTDGGNADCTEGTTCVSGKPITPKSYCLIVCGDDAGACPSPLTCADAGVCL